MQRLKFTFPHPVCNTEQRKNRPRKCHLENKNKKEEERERKHESLINNLLTTVLETIRSVLGWTVARSFPWNADKLAVMAQTDGRAIS